MTATRPKLVADARHAERAGGCELADPRQECVVNVRRIVDPRGDPHEDARLTQLSEDPRRDAEARCEDIGAGWRGASGAQLAEHAVHTSLHLGTEPGTMLGQQNATTVPDELAAANQLIDQFEQRRVINLQRRGTPVRRRARRAGISAESLDQGVDPYPLPERIGPMQAPQGRHQTVLGAAPQRRIHRSGQRVLAASVVPCTAMRIAWLSSSERACRDSPFSTGLAKRRVFVRPWRLLSTMPSWRSSSRAMAKL